ncbi:DUF2066 domain-containing protein [Alteromonas sp. ASW11-19]|uniref:DUF2066 domain-containing protein n=1 Tax=Alteromonas salexigens TaxID=2982530 RepID=A0ABT2VLV2_9ALTE|nr:DUF2066 domain-containing protein [Alteromonas salexigens]MCU7554055.1 DUF2066 domain-containing protein [Alteromonas salexigens]
MNSASLVSVIQTIWLVIFSFVLLGSSVANATVQIDTHVGHIEVQDQSQDTQKRAAKDALLQVLVKMSGTTQVEDIAGVRAALRNPNQYLRSYRFNERRDALYYVAEFDPQGLTQILRRENLPVWGNRRPESIIWLAVEDERGQRHIVEEAAKSPVSDAIRNTAQARGIRVSLPLMDLTDNQAISVYDIWGRFAKTLVSASSRYGVDYVVAARLYKNNGSEVPTLPAPDQDKLLNDALNKDWDRPVQDLENELEGDGASSAYRAQSPAAASDVMPFSSREFESMMARQGEGAYALDWVFIRNGDVKTGSLYGDDPADLTALLMEGYASYLADIFSIKPGVQQGEPQQLQISVANLDSLAHFVNAQRYLKSLSVVDQVTLTRQSRSVGTFTLSLLGSPQDFLNTMALENRLSPVKDAFGQPVQGYNFYWNQ